MPVVSGPFGVAGARRGDAPGCRRFCPIPVKESAVSLMSKEPGAAVAVASWRRESCPLPARRRHARRNDSCDNRNGPGVRFSAWLIPLLALAVGGCVTNPVTGEKDFITVSQAQEIAIGEQQYQPAQQSQGGTYEVDRDLTSYVAGVGRRVAGVQGVPELPYEFVVLNDSSPNAWALPGGKIAINRGLLVLLDNEAELAAVLGHEVVHAGARHGAQRISQGQLLQGGLVLGSVLTQGKQYQNLALAGAQLGAQLISTKYGRDAERESDFYGTKYLHDAGYDATAAVTLQQKFVELSKGRNTGGIGAFFASHPPSEERVQNNRRRVAELGAGGELGTDRYERALAYVKGKSAAYKQYDEAKAALSKQQIDTADSKVRAALAAEPNEALFHGLYGNVAYLRGDFQQAFARYDRAVGLNARHYDLLLGRGMSALKLNRNGEAQRDLEASYRLLPTAISANELGKLRLNAGDTQGARELFGLAAGSAGAAGAEARAYATRIDLRTNPGRLFRTQVGVVQGELVGQVSNASGVALKNIVVEFRVRRADGKVAQIRRHIRVLDAQTAARVGSGVRVGETQPAAELVVLSAQPR